MRAKLLTLVLTIGKSYQLLQRRKYKLKVKFRVEPSYVSYAKATEDFGRQAVVRLVVYQGPRYSRFEVSGFLIANMFDVILQGRRVTLRPIKLSDAPNYLRWLNDKKVIRYLLAQQGVTMAKEKAYIKGILKKDSRNNNFAIINEDGKHIGSASLDKVDTQHKSALFGIVIGEKNEWGKGYAQECVKILADYLFKKLKFNRLTLHVASENKPAIAAYTKAGFVQEGLLRRAEWNLVTKKFQDTIVMSILRSDWLKRK